jgi:prepilin-type N-terminal cleavage/methylation domain-containing protein
MKNLKTSGFTLIEIVLAITILATLTVMTSQSIQQALKAKSKISDQLTDMSKVRDSLRVIERDVNLAYHYRDLELEIEAELRKRNQPQTPQIPGQPPPPPVDMYQNSPEYQQRMQFRKDPTTHFVGTAESMDFATQNTGRVLEAELMADFIKVGYSLEPCKKMNSEGSASQCLVRRQANIVEGDITKGGEKTILLEDVSEFKLRYFGKGRQEWNSDWSSLSGDGATQGNFPQAVEISLGIEVERAGNKKKVSMQIVAAVRNPNNSDGRTRTRP